MRPWSGYLRKLDHHLLRDRNYKQKIISLHEAAQKQGVKVTTAAEYKGLKVELLEALRKELYAQHNFKP
jgi:hypothetical protein